MIKKNIVSLYGIRQGSVVCDKTTVGSSDRRYFAPRDLFLRGPRASGRLTYVAEGKRLVMSLMCFAFERCLSQWMPGCEACSISVFLPAHLSSQRDIFFRKDYYPYPSSSVSRKISCQVSSINSRINCVHCPRRGLNYVRLQLAAGTGSEISTGGTPLRCLLSSSRCLAVAARFFISSTAPFSRKSVGCRFAKGLSIARPVMS